MQSATRVALLRDHFTKDDSHKIFCVATCRHLLVSVFGVDNFWHVLGSRTRTGRPDYSDMRSFRISGHTVRVEPAFRSGADLVLQRCKSFCTSVVFAGSGVPSRLLALRRPCFESTAFDLRKASVKKHKFYLPYGKYELHASKNTLQQGS